MLKRVTPSLTRSMDCEADGHGGVALWGVSRTLTICCGVSISSFTALQPT